MTISTIKQVKKKKPSKAEKMFFAEIKRMNDAGEQGGSKIMQVDEKTAMLIYWRKSSWTYELYPFVAVEYVRQGS